MQQFLIQRKIRCTVLQAWPRSQGVAIQKLLEFPVEILQVAAEDAPCLLECLLAGLRLAVQPLDVREELVERLEGEGVPRGLEEFLPIDHAAAPSAGNGSAAHCATTAQM